MKYLGLILAMVFSVNALASDFVHPLDFDDSEKKKQKVIRHIESSTKELFCDPDPANCQEVTLRMIEKQNLKAFKSLTQVKDRKILDSVIALYCDPAYSSCHYSTLWMMYRQNEKAAGESLAW